MRGFQIKCISLVLGCPGFTALMRGFQIKCISLVTRRNVGIATCGTDWLFTSSETPIATDGVKIVLTVVLSWSAQLSDRLPTSSMVFWIR